MNPLAGLNPEISDLAILCRLSGISYVELIGMIMESALERVDGSSALRAMRAA
jgi:D-alanine-D-alanine ligase